MTQAPQDISGHDATDPSEFLWPAWKAVLHRVWIRIYRDHLSIIAAGVAFFGILAIFPSIAALIGLYGLIANPADVASNLLAVRPLLPHDVYGLIEGQVAALIAARPKLGLASFLALIFALWSARAGVAALVEGLNIVYREYDDRSFLVQYLLSLLLTFLLLVFGVAAISVIVAVPTILHFSDIGPVGTRLAQLTPLLILGVALVFVIGALYRYGPRRSEARKRWVSYGAVMATAAWVLASLLLSIYISRFANFNETYGSLGAIVGLLLWLYVGAFAVLLGAELNAEMELQTARDTTTGPEKPMGQRGAFVADHVAPPLPEDAPRGGA